MNLGKFCKSLYVGMHPKSSFKLKPSVFSIAIPMVLHCIPLDFQSKFLKNLDAVYFFHREGYKADDIRISQMASVNICFLHITVHISAYQSTISRNHWLIKNWWIIRIIASMLKTSLKICVPSKTWLHTTNHAMTGLLTTTKLFTQRMRYWMVQLNQTKEGTQLTIPKLLPNRNEERFKRQNSRAVCSYRRVQIWSE